MNISPDVINILVNVVFVRHGSVKAVCRGEVNSLGTPRSAERPGSFIPDQQSIKDWTGRQDDERPTTWADGSGDRKMLHDMLLLDLESRSTGSRF